MHFVGEHPCVEQREGRERTSWDFPGGSVLRICLPAQGTQVQSLVQKDPACHRAVKPVRCKYRVHALEPGLYSKSSHRNWKDPHAAPTSINDNF